MQQNRTLPNWRLLLKLKWRLQSPRPLQGGYVYNSVMTFVCELFYLLFISKNTFQVSSREDSGRQTQDLDKRLNWKTCLFQGGSKPLPRQVKLSSKDLFNFINILILNLFVCRSTFIYVYSLDRLYPGRPRMQAEDISWSDKDGTFGVYRHDPNYDGPNYFVLDSAPYKLFMLCHYGIVV